MGDTTSEPTQPNAAGAGGGSTGQQATVAGSPPPMTWVRTLLYAASSLTLGATQGLGANLVTANLPAVQAALAATPNEAAWLSAAYLSTSATASVLLLKFRQQYGIRRFAELGLMLFVVANFTQLFSRDLGSAVLVRALAGFAAAPLTTLAILYMSEPQTPEKRFPISFCFGLIGSQSGPALARLVSPGVLEVGHAHGLGLLELGLALVCLAIVLLLPLTPTPRQRSFDWVDALSFPAFAGGIGLVAVALSLARLYWWQEAPWLGICLAAGIALLTLVVVLELNRARPMLDLRWLATGDMLAVAGALMMVRMLLASEQTVGAAGKFQGLGFLNDYMQTFYAVVLAATVAGFVCAYFVYRPGREPAIHAVALLAVALGAWIESSSTNLTRPADFYATQALVAFGGGLFLPTAMLPAMQRVVQRGMYLMTSFIAMFLVTQNIGSLLASAVLGTFVTVREKFHSNQITEGLTLLDPFVAARLAQYDAVYARVLTDPALRAGEGAGLLAQLASREATVLAYNDLFMLTALLAVLTLLLLLAHTAIHRLRAAPAPATV